MMRFAFATPFARSISAWISSFADVRPSPGVLDHHALGELLLLELRLARHALDVHLVVRKAPKQACHHEGHCQNQGHMGYFFTFAS